MGNSIGHQKIKEKLSKIILSGNIANAYLFVGQSGVGKKLIATEFAKSILCDSSANGTYCNHCASCLTFYSNADFKMISPEKDVIKVDTIRLLIEEIFLMPTISKRKVFIIDEADKMNEQAQNALLKVLEEPPAYATIILVASGKEKLLNTIRSRVVEFQFEKLKPEEIKEILTEELHIEFDEEKVENAIMYANGSVTKVREYLEDDTFLLSQDLSKILLEKDFLKMNRKIEEIKADKNLKANIVSILEKVMFIFYHELKKNITFDYQLVEIMEDTIEKIKKNANVDLALDVMMIQICGL